MGAEWPGPGGQVGFGGHGGFGGLSGLGLAALDAAADDLATAREHLGQAVPREWRGLGAGGYGDRLDELTGAAARAVALLAEARARARRLERELAAHRQACAPLGWSW